MPVLTVHRGTNTNSYTYTKGKTLSELLRAFGYFLDAPCGGHGLCGKCRVTLKTADGINTVLACQTVVETDCEIWMRETVKPAEASTGVGGRAADTFEAHLKLTADASALTYGVAVDLGTTTVVMALCDLATGKRIATLTQRNNQSSFGADVLTRIGYCIENENGLTELQTCVRSQLAQMLSELCDRTGIPPVNIKRGFIAGNTVMEHILAGISPGSIATAPYKPLSLFCHGEQIILSDVPFALSPCVAGYVGGDITAGLLTLSNASDQTVLFIDVGTNGEIVLKTPAGYTACAVACGPAFEGANITCGMAAEEGAVTAVAVTEEGLSYEVLGEIEAKGLCGSGLIDLAACLTELGYIDESGLLENDFGEPVFSLTADVFLNQKDVRQLQLAKAAVCAGIRRLTDFCGVDYGDIDTVCLAGSFGEKLRVESAVSIGMLPKALAGKMQAVGNTSLTGAAMALVSPEKQCEPANIKARCHYLELSSDREFENCFVAAMEFCEQ